MVGTNLQFVSKKKSDTCETQYAHIGELEDWWLGDDNASRVLKTQAEYFF